MLQIHRDKLHNNGYEKVAISQLDSVKKEPKLQDLIEKGLIPLEIEEYKKTVFIYALIKQVNNEKLKRYETRLLVQFYEPSYIQSVNSSKNKIDIFAEFDDVFLLHDPIAYAKAELEAAKKAESKTKAKDKE